MQRYLYNDCRGKTRALKKKRGVVLQDKRCIIPVFDIKSIKISKMHKNVFICKKKSKSVEIKFSTYPHQG